MRCLTGLFVATLLACGISPAAAAYLAKFDRSIGRELEFQTKTLRYCLLVVGPEAKNRVWVAYDGAGPYTDRTGNLSADERSNIFGDGFEPFEVADVPGPDRYVVRFMKILHYVALEVKGKFQQYSFATFDERSHNRKSAPVAHFNGPLAMRSQVGDGTKLAGGARAVLADIPREARPAQPIPFPGGVVDAELQTAFVNTLS